MAGTRSPLMRALAGRDAAWVAPPAALVCALSSACLTKGTMRDFTASMSCDVSAMDFQRACRWCDLRSLAHFGNLVCSARPRGGLLAVPIHLKSAENPSWFTASGKQRSGVSGFSIELQILLVWPARMTTNDGSGPVSEASLASSLSHEDFPRAAIVTAHHTGDQVQNTRDQMH